MASHKPITQTTGAGNSNILEKLVSLKNDGFVQTRIKEGGKLRWDRGPEMANQGGHV